MGSGASTSRREVEEWGADDVTKYISSLGEDFLPYFEKKQNGSTPIDGRALLQCGDKELVDLGLDAAHRHKLLDEKVKHTANWNYHGAWTYSIAYINAHFFFLSSLIVQRLYVQENCLESRISKCARVRAYTC